MRKRIEDSDRRRRISRTSSCFEAVEIRSKLSPFLLKSINEQLMRKSGHGHGSAPLTTTPKPSWHRLIVLLVIYCQKTDCIMVRDSVSVSLRYEKAFLKVILDSNGENNLLQGWVPAKAT
jgi:hypothetical protein